MQFYGVVSSSLEDDRSAQEAATISSEQFNEAAKRSGRTMQDLAELLGVDRSTIYYYKRHGVAQPARTVAHVRQKMGLWLREGEQSPLLGYSTEDLLNELARRFAYMSAVVEKHRPSSKQPEPDDNERPAGTGGGRYTGTGGPPD